MIAGWLSCAALCALCGGLTARLYRALRWWFCCAWEYNAAMYYLSMLPRAVELSCVYVFAVRGYFSRTRTLLYWIFFASALAFPAFPILLLCNQPASFWTLAALYMALVAVPYGNHWAFRRVRGTDGKRHECFDRYAKLRVMDQKRIRLEKKQSKFTFLLGFLMRDQSMESFEKTLEQVESERSKVACFERKAPVYIQPNEREQ